MGNPTGIGIRDHVCYLWLTRLLTTGGCGAGSVSRAEYNKARRKMQAQYGVPRRFSENFLHEEHERLNNYRARAREALNGQRQPTKGIGSLLSSHGAAGAGDTPALLHVGQHVVAIHNDDRLPHFGKILTSDARGQCRVQFERGDLGVQLLPDTQIMPFNDMVMPWAEQPMAMPVFNTEEVEAEEEKKDKPPAAPQVVVDLRIPTETLKLLDQKEKLVAAIRDVSNRAAAATGGGAAAAGGGAPAAALAPEFSRLMAELKSVDERLNPLLGYMRRYTDAATGKTDTDDVPHHAEVEGATCTPEQLREQVKQKATDAASK